MKKRVSVAMVTYNGGDFVSEQIETIVSQTYTIYELIIVDDSSSDNTWNILDKYRLRFPNLIKCYRNVERLGPHSNYKKAISLCTGDFICLADQDDIWMKEKIDTLLNLLLERNKRIAISNEKILYEDGSFGEKKIAPVPLERLIFNNTFPAHLFMFDRKLNSIFLNVESSFPIDETLALWGLINNEIAYCNNELVIWRRHPNACTISSHSIQPTLIFSKKSKYLKVLSVVFAFCFSRVKSKTIQSVFLTKSNFIKEIAKTKNDFLLADVTKNISKQTFASYVLASFGLLRILLKTNDLFRTQSFLNKLKMIAFEFCYSFVYWYDCNKIKAL